MFQGCIALTSLDVSGFDTGSAESMNRMFGHMTGITSLDLSGFSTENARDLGNMFAGSTGLRSLDLSSFSTPNLEIAYTMFQGCSRLQSLDISGMNTRNISEYNLSNMFDECTSLSSITLGPDTILNTKTPRKGWKRTKLLTGEAADGPAITNFSQYSGVDPGVYTYTGAGSASAAATQKAQPMTVKALKKSLKAAKLKKTALAVSALRVKDAKGTVTYKKLSGSPKLTIASGTGKIKVKKGTKKGTYTITVRVTAAGNSSYKAGAKKVTVKIKVK